MTTTTTTQLRLDSLAALIQAVLADLHDVAARDPEPARWYVAAARLSAAETAVRDARKAVQR